MIIFYLTHGLVSSLLLLLHNRTKRSALDDAQTKSVPSFNPLSSSPVRGSSEWAASGLLPAGDGGINEEIEEDTRDMGSADDFNDTQPRRSLRKAKIIASQGEKSTSGDR